MASDTTLKAPEVVVKDLLYDNWDLDNPLNNENRTFFSIRNQQKMVQRTPVTIEVSPSMNTELLEAGLYNSSTYRHGYGVQIEIFCYPQKQAKNGINNARNRRWKCLKEVQRIVNESTDIDYFKQIILRNTGQPNDDLDKGELSIIQYLECVSAE